MKKGLFDLHFQVTVCHLGKVMVEASNHKSHHIHSQEQREMDTHIITCLWLSDLNSGSIILTEYQVQVQLCEVYLQSLILDV